MIKISANPTWEWQRSKPNGVSTGFLTAAIRALGLTAAAPDAANGHAGGSGGGELPWQDVRDGFLA